MASKKRNISLHLQNLSINGFRGISSLELPDLGRVNLFAGKNSIGKTTVLEAVQVYASRGAEDTLHEIVRNREEFDSNYLEDGEEVEWLNLATLFFGRQPDMSSSLEIGPDPKKSEKLVITLASDRDIEEHMEKNRPKVRFRDYAEQGANFLKVKFKNSVNVISGSVDARRPSYRRIRPISNGDRSPPAIVCHWIGPGILSNTVIARFWDQVALKDEEKIAVNAIGMVMDTKVDRLTMVGDDFSRFRGRRPIVKLGRHNPVSLKALGDGAVRLFATALAMTNCANGFLLIDEAENGIHHSVQQQFWKMVLDTASKYDIQIFATTHSIDCVKGFARAALESQENGVLYRLENKDQKFVSVRYSEEDLEAATMFNTEVR